MDCMQNELRTGPISDFLLLRADQWQAAAKTSANYRWQSVSQIPVRFKLIEKEDIGIRMETVTKRKNSCKPEKRSYR